MPHPDHCRLCSEALDAASLSLLLPIPRMEQDHENAYLIIIFARVPLQYTWTVKVFGVDGLTSQRHFDGKLVCLNLDRGPDAAEGIGLGRRLQVEFPTFSVPFRGVVHVVIPENTVTCH